MEDLFDNNNGIGSMILLKKVICRAKRKWFGNKIERTNFLKESIISTLNEQFHSIEW